LRFSIADLSCEALVKRDFRFVFVMLGVLLLPAVLVSQEGTKPAGLQAWATAPNFNLNRLGGGDSLRLYNFAIGDLRFHLTQEG